MQFRDVVPGLFLAAVIACTGGGDQTPTPKPTPARVATPTAAPMPTTAGVPVAEGVGLLAKWGSEGTGDGQFRSPMRIALDA